MNGHPEPENMVAGGCGCMVLLVVGGIFLALLLFLLGIIKHLWNWI